MAQAPNKYAPSADAPHKPLIIPLKKFGAATAITVGAVIKVASPSLPSTLTEYSLPDIQAVVSDYCKAGTPPPEEATVIVRKRGRNLVDTVTLPCADIYKHGFTARAVSLGKNYCDTRYKQNEIMTSFGEGLRAKCGSPER